MAPPPAQRPRPYRDFLTPALHRQFVHASVLSLCACYIPAIWLSNAGYIWRFLPLGTAFRAVVLFIVTSMFLLLTRLAGQHAGQQTAFYPLQTFQRALLNPVTYFVVASYPVSAYLYAEVTSLSYSSDSYLKIVTPASHNHRAHLNEEGIFFRFLFPILGLLQAGYHLWFDVDRVRLPMRKTKIEDQTGITRLLSNQALIVPLVVRAAAKTILTAFGGGFLYFAFFRRLLWSWCFALFRKVYFFPRNASHRRNSSNGLLWVWITFLLSAFFLTLIWDFTNLVFSQYMAQAPMKKGQPITSGSKDPNGSLLSGLQAKAELSKTRAFWELELISNSFDIRRKNIYLELDRAGASTWSQLSRLCLQEIADISVRISAFNTSSHPPAPELLPSTHVKHAHIDKESKNDPSIFAAPSQPATLGGKAERLITAYATSQAQKPGAVSPPVYLARKGMQSLLTQDQRNHLQPQAIREQAEGVMARLVKTSLGYPLRQTFQERITAVICGTPVSRTSTLIDAVDALSSLVAHSITEDQPGQVQKDVANICRAYAGAIVQIKDFIASTRPHWSDVGFAESQRKSGPEVDAVLQALQSGLEKMVRAFGEYFSALTVSQSEQRQWTQLLEQPKPQSTVAPRTAEKKAIARPRTPPMQQVSR